MKTRVFQLLPVLLLIQVMTIAQEVQVRIPNVTAMKGDTILLSVELLDTLVGYEIYSFENQLYFSNNIFKPIEVLTTGSISDSLGSFVHKISAPNTFSKLLNVSMAHNVALADTGVLYFIRGVVLNSGSIQFNGDNYFNEGMPVMDANDGYITATNPPTIFVSPTTGNNNLINGEQRTFTASGGDGPYFYSVSDTAIASIDSTTGVLNALAVGTLYVSATDTNGNTGTSHPVYVRVSQVSVRDTQTYALDTITMLLETSDLSMTPISSGYVRFQYQTSRARLLDVEAGPMLEGIAQPFFAEGSSGVTEVVFAGATSISGEGDLLRLTFEVLSVSFNTTMTVTLHEVSFDEGLHANLDNGFLYITGLPTLSVSGGGGFMYAGETRQLSVSNGIPPYTWTVDDPEAATIDESGLLRALRSGYVTVSAVDSVGSTGNAHSIQIYDAELRVESICADIGDTVLLPVFLTDLPGDQMLGSFKFRLDYNATYLHFIDFVKENTESSDWQLLSKPLTNDDIQVNAAGSALSPGNQPILFIAFEVTGSMPVNGTASVNLYDVLLNEGVPFQRTVNGYVRQSSRRIDSIQVLEQSACDLGNNKYTQVLRFHFTNPPATGSLIVNDTSFSLNGMDTLTATLVLDSDGTTKHLYCVFAPGNGCNFIFYNAFQAPQPCRTDVIYVDKQATGSNTGANWSDAYVSLQTALASVGPDSEVKTEIWVAEGTYTPASSDRSASFSIESNVSVLGGFSGTETSNDQRAPSLHATILSGDIGIPADSSDNSYHIVQFIHTDSTARLDGFVLRNGRADGVDPLDQVGGAIFCDKSKSQVVQCTFTNNFALYGGGALAAYGSGGNSSVRVESCRFEGNSTPGLGGACLVNGFDGVSLDTFVRCTWIQNTALNGGAVYNNGFDGVCDPAFQQCRFIGNEAASNGGAIYNFGRQNGQCNPSIENSLFWKNHAALNGACLYADAQLGGTSEATYINCTFSNNHMAGQGFVSYAHTANPLFTNSILWNGDGGTPLAGILTTPTVTYSVIEGGATGTGNFDADPMFVDTTAGDLRVVGCSPAVDAGDNASAPATDIRGVLRPFSGGNTEIGAYEIPGNPFDGSGNIAFIDSAANGLHDGSSFDHGYNNIEAAFLFANCDTDIDTLCIADGTYRPPNDTLQMAALTIDRDLYVAGGYEGIGGAPTQQADPDSFITTFSGDIGIIGDTTDNLPHVVYIGSGSTNSTLTGLHIRHGTTTDSTGMHASGAGLLIDGTIIIDNVILTDNSSTHGASAIHLNPDASLTLINSELLNNFGGIGTAILALPGSSLDVLGINALLK